MLYSQLTEPQKAAIVVRVETLRSQDSHEEAIQALQAGNLQSALNLAGEARGRLRTAIQTAERGSR